MSAETSSSSMEPTPLTPAAGSGPLARFTRQSQAGEEQKQPAEQPAQPAAAKPEPMVPAGQPPAGYRPRGKSDRPKTRREKEKEEDRQIDRELAAERGNSEER